VALRLHDPQTALTGVFDVDTPDGIVSLADAGST